MQNVKRNREMRSMKLNKLLIVLLFIVSLSFLITGCGDSKKAEKVKENKKVETKVNDNIKTLTCTKIKANSKGYVSDYKDTFVYENGVLKSGELTENQNYAKLIEDMTYEETVEFFEQDEVKNKKCVLAYMDINIFKGGIKGCTQEWNDYWYKLIYYIDVDKLKDKEEFKDINNLKDFFEKAVYKCEIK